MNITDEQREKIMRLAAETTDAMCEILGRPADLAMVLHPDHAEDEPCDGSMVLTSAPMVNTMGILLGGVDKVDKMIRQSAPKGATLN